MKINKTLSTMCQWLFIACGLFAPTYVRAQVDPAPDGAYTSFSTVYNGKRYYLGVDTLKAKEGTPTDTITWYDHPNYATIWQMGEVHVTAGAYMRTIKSVWMAERVERDRCLALGADKGTYSLLVLKEEALATMWQAAASENESNKYIEGYIYYYSDATGVDVYRYLTYDPLFGFSRVYSSRPTSPYRVSIWDRKQGDDLRFDFRPETHVFGLETERTTTILPLTAKVTFYEDVDRFRSRDGRIDVFAKEPTVIDNQATLIAPPYNLTMYYEWASNPRSEDQHPTTAEEFVNDSYNGNSLMKYWNTYDHLDEESGDVVGAWKDTILMHIRNFSFKRNADNTLWHDTLYTVGTSPFDRPESRFLRPEGEPGSDPGEGLYTDHADWLNVYFSCKGRPYKDSALVMRQTFHNEPFTRLTSSVSPVDHVFPYKPVGETPETSDIEATFTVTIRYVEGNRIVYANGNTERTVLGEEQELDIASIPSVVIDDREYNKLTVEALLPNGNSAIYDEEENPDGWIESVAVDGNEISVRVKQQPALSPNQRTAQLRFSYNYLHSTAAGDNVLTERSIWITQKSAAEGDAQIYAFHHKGETTTPQPVHTKYSTLYAIPGQDLQLALHRDHWGYYRWYEWDYRGGAYETDLAHSNWTWESEPVNSLEEEYMLINHVTDVSSRGRWDVLVDGNNHFTVGKPTVVPAIAYPESYTKTDSIACDVSAYTNIATTGVIGESLTSLTEPTLSYRQIFAVRPAKEQADKMADCRVNGGEGHNKWMEDKVIIAPATRAITLAQQYPVSDKAASDVEDELQYIYYFNPDAEGTADEDMGTKKGSVAYTEAACYARIGRKYKSGVTLRRAKLLTKTDLDNMSTDATMNVFVAHPRKNNGYLLGGTSSQQKAYYVGVFKGRTDTADLRSHLETDILNANVNYNNYKLTLTKTGSGTIKLTSYTSGQALYAHKGVFSIGAGVDWGQSSLQANNSTIQYAAHSSTSLDRITDIDDALLELKMSAAILWAYDGSLTAYDGSNASLHLDKTSSDINKGWCIYQIIEPVAAEHYETPRWYKKASGDADWVCVANGDSTAVGYTMLDNGNLQIDEKIHTAANETIQYCLRTEHFHLAKFTLVTRDAVTEGPAEKAIIPVETMENQYDILFSMTTDNGHFPWEQSEMSYHYSTTDIGEEYRVLAGDEPAKGEYAFMRSFRGIDAISGIGATDYLLCLNAAESPVQFMNFEYPQLMCSDQQLYFTAEICNPIQNGYNPQITAEMEGYNGSTWVPIYRYVTGELPYDEGKWYQLVMPIAQSAISGYEKFRFIGYLSGSAESEAFVLLDHMRFIAKARPLSIFQNKATCLDTETNKIDIVARLDYQNASFASGTLVAYQYQKLVDEAYVPLDHETDGMDYVNDIDGTMNSKTDINGRDCGVIRIPAEDFNPAVGPSAAYIRPLGGVTSTTRSYVNEGTEDDAYWTMYLSQKVSATANDTFRVAMAVIPNASDAPNFSTAGCATERIVGVKKPVVLYVDGSEWTAARSAEDVTANNTYRVKAVLTDATLPTGYKAGSGTCKFDILRSTETVDYNTLIAAWQAAMKSGTEEEIAAAKALVDAADAAFLAECGVNHSDLLDYLEIFRNPASPHAETTNWNDVHPLDFTYSGRSEEESRKIYNVLDNLITTKRKLQIGVDYHDVFMGSDDDIYFHLHPLPASGRYIVNATGEEERIEVCNSPIWFEMHSATAAYEMRLGYDNEINGNFQVPVIRASKTDANAHLKVRIAEITHSGETGVLIGWDSTQVVDSNDPEWLKGGKTFRYHQDRIAQTDIFANYYQIPEEDAETDPRRFVVFRPLTSSYVDSLGMTTCPCYNYDPSGTVHGTEGGGHDLTKVSDSGCNPWGVLPRAKGETGADSKEAPHPMPGHRTANNMSLKAGYWYRFRTAFFNMSGTVVYNATDDVGINHAEFILAVAPDTVRWTPSHPESANYWNDDDNWMAIVEGKDLHDCIASIPMSDSKVIIPAPAQENMLPIVDNTVLHEVDDHDYGFEQNTCSEILFYPNATMLGQENLEYNRAFVDVQMLSGNWQTFSPALKYIYTGDMYIPQDTARSSDRDFLPHRFQNDDGTSAGENAWSENYNRVWPYATYQGFYNTTVQVAYQNTDEDDNPNAYRIKSSADWIETNVLNRPLTPGHAEVIKGYGPSDEDGERLVVRLPKQETKYHYILETPLGSGTYAASHDAETMEGKPAWASLTNNLAFDKYSVNPSDTSITVTLTNETVSKVFFFGNPTMALVDVYELCKLNKDQLESGGSANTYKFTAYQLREGASSYTTKIISGPGQFYIAPQRAVGLIATDAVAASKTLSVKLSPRALVAMTGDGSTVTPSLSAPQRRNSPSAAASPYSRYLYISAANRTNDGLSKSYLTLGEESGASRGFQQGEDVLTLNSGLEYYSDASFSTPMTLFTIADNQPLMYDVRDTVGCVPVVFTTLDDHYTFDNTTVLSFATQGEWDRPLYLYDALTQDSVLIVNGLQIEVETPLSDQLRYFINGLPAPRATDQPGIATGIESVNPQDDLSFDSENGRTFIYDMLGRPVMTLGEYDLLHTVQLPTGVYLIRRGATTERRIIR